MPVLNLGLLGCRFGFHDWRWELTRAGMRSVCRRCGRQVLVIV